MFKRIYRAFIDRYDGRRLKSISPFIKMMPYIMPKRYDAQVFSKVIIETDIINSYIKDKLKEGHRFSYLHIFVASFVKTIAQRPQLNRFVMNNKLYARKGIWISMAIKRRLRDDGEETTVKFSFTGKEDIFEIAEIINKSIMENKGQDDENETDRLASLIMSFPNFMIKLMMAMIRQMDRWGILPKAVIEASPFHTTLFFTYLKSIKLDYVYHHIYDLGNTGIFISLGREKRMAIADRKGIHSKKAVEMGVALDERICDGLYFSNSVKLMNRYFNNPYLLEEKLDEIVEDVD